MHFRLISKLSSALLLFITVVYASNDPFDRLSLWHSLCRISSSFAMWLVSRDFNEVRYAHEKEGGRPIHTRRAKKFNECIEKCGLEDLKACGHTLSWNNQQSNCIACRLDRTLDNNEFFMNYPTSVAQYFTPGFFDHAGIKTILKPQLPSGPAPSNILQCGRLIQHLVKLSNQPGTEVSMVPLYMLWLRNLQQLRRPSNTGTKQSSVLLMISYKLRRGCYLMHNKFCTKTVMPQGGPPRDAASVYKISEST
ncbi:hypothetical protein QJS04_geneDACA020406 [Acorus gramineus]|uniref:Uncharacterized protein n=1 Tax=Acorus gramineus TaxID=55184 RepID=A0AAV9BPJ7_ACOGR|nr:hypothetical protein QJS04_geneDACA020406 [Acorus gramineus]